LAELSNAYRPHAHSCHMHGCIAYLPDLCSGLNYLTQPVYFFSMPGPLTQPDFPPEILCLIQLIHFADFTPAAYPLPLFRIKSSSSDSFLWINMIRNQSYCHRSRQAKILWLGELMHLKL